MSSRFGRSDRDDLFSTYNRSASPSKQKQKPTPSPRASPYSPNGGGASYAYTSTPSDGSGPSFGAYPGGSGNGSLYPSSGFGSSVGVGGSGKHDGGYRSATPNSRGQYSSSVLDELESQNDNEHVGVLTSKVKQLKDLTHLIGDEIRDSTALAEKMNDQFENSRLRLRGTMNRMLRMAEKTGVGWKVWLGFFAAVILLFWWVWLG